MADKEVAAVGIDLDGSFTAEANKAADAGDRVSQMFDEIGKRAEKGGANVDRMANAMGSLARASKTLRGSQLSDVGAGIANVKKQLAQFDLAPELERQKMALEQKLSSRRNAMREQVRLEQGGWAGGGQAADGMEQLAGKSAMMGAMAGGAASIAVAGLGKIMDFAERAAVKVYELGKAFTEAGIRETSFRERASASLNKLGAGSDFAIRIGAKYGLNQEEAVTQVKSLLAAKFKVTEIPALVRLRLGMAETMGEGKAAEFFGQLEEKQKQVAERLRLGTIPRASMLTIKEFADAGVSMDAIWKALAAKLGTSTDAAKQAVRRGAVDMQTAIEAAKKAAGAEFGGVADKIANTVPALLVRVKMGIANLFSGFDLTPLKDTLKNLAGLLEGPEGKLLKKEFSDTGNEILKALFGPFQGNTGRQRMIGLMTELVEVLRAVKEAAKAAAPYLKFFLFDRVASPAQGSLKDNIDANKRRNAEGNGPIGSKGMGLPDGMLGNAFGPPLNDRIAQKLNFDDLLDPTRGKAGTIGEAIDQGLAQAIEQGGEGQGAVARLAQKMLATLRAQLGVHSPSTEAAWIGSMFGQGFAQGAGNDNGVTAATSGMASKALGGAAGGAGATGGGGGAVTIIVQVQVAEGASAEAQGQAAGDAAYRAWQRMARRNAREAAA